MSRSFFALGFVAAGAIFASQALAEDFHGYDPATFDGAMLPAEHLKATVADAMDVTPPKNGKSYVIGFANLDARHHLLQQGRATASGERQGGRDRTRLSPTTISTAPPRSPMPRASSIATSTT